MFVKSKTKSFSFSIAVVAMQLLVLIFFVSITLAQDDGKSESQESQLQKNSSNTTNNEERYRSAGILFPSLDEIRESFKRFQERLNNFRKSGGGFSTADPRQLQNLSNTNSNSYFRNGNFYGSGAFPSTDDSESVYPPGFRRPGNTYYKTATANTSADLQQHTTTTIWIICICLIIMAVGSILFICVNKCQGPPVSNSNSSGSPSRNSRSTNNLSSSSSNRNSRISVSTISIAIPSSTPSGSSSISNIPGANIDYDGKYSFDMPPSYDSLFPISNTGK